MQRNVHLGKRVLSMAAAAVLAILSDKATFEASVLLVIPSSIGSVSAPD